MQKRKLLIAVPIAIVAFLLLRCWSVLIFTDTVATWRHYAGLLLYLPLIFLFFKKYTKATIGTGIYLLLATFNILSFMPVLKTSWITFNFSIPISTPPIQLISLGIFVIYFILNLDSLIEIYLDYKGVKAA